MAHRIPRSYPSTNLSGDNPYVSATFRLELESGSLNAQTNPTTRVSPEKGRQYPLQEFQKKLDLLF